MLLVCLAMDPTGNMGKKLPPGAVALFPMMKAPSKSRGFDENDI